MYFTLFYLLKLYIIVVSPQDSSQNYLHFFTSQAISEKIHHWVDDQIEHDQDQFVFLY